ncbi:MAG: hypothetical protein HBSIN02_05300 [Bacteroidia bacterium]|nr:MAG: hypothetical protein HBSIN02_05300 [Bacteroidia bacterium]
MKPILHKATVAAAILFLTAMVWSQSYAQPGTPANSVIGFPGAGVIQAGDLWESLLPAGFGPFYGEAGDAPTRGNRQFIRFGNFDRAWTTPNSHWPGAFPWTMYWSHYMYVTEYNPDTLWNPYGNPSRWESGGAGNYAYLAFKSTVAGANNPARLYSVEPYFVDAAKNHVVYEAGFPTNLGVDVKIRAHGFSGPNWNNLNDFVIVEIEFTNTGEIDIDMNGMTEATNHVIRALALTMSGEIFQSISSQPGGGRNVNSISNRFTRMGGWIHNPAPDGFPWAFNAYYAGSSLQTPGAGQNDLGFNAPTIKSYTDTWNGWVWIDAKSGTLPADPNNSSASLPTKNNIFGVHPIGTGAQRGDYVSTGSGGGLAATGGDPRRMHTVAIGAFYQNGGSSRSIADLDRSPNDAFFLSGTQGDPTTFVRDSVGGSAPDGDQKGQTFEQGPFEDGTATTGTPYPTGWGTWSKTNGKGYNFGHDFNGDMYSGIGPFQLNDGESMVVVLGLVGGYRLEGIQKAVRAARWAYQTNWMQSPTNGRTSPIPPYRPLMKVSNTLTKTVEIEWDNGAESRPGFAGYKIWKSSNFLKKKWLEEGHRLADRYQEQMVVGASKDSLKKPVNPKFDAFSAVAAAAQKGEYQPDTWGTWELVQVIPAAQVGNYTGGTTPYTYKYTDADVVLGFSYWYYVSAYYENTATPYEGPDGETTTRIETHYTNRNGANGLWQKTYPFATNNANYPTTAAGKQAIGGVHIVSSALAAAGDVANVGVRPNPYKRAALHDNFSNVFDHKLLFYNLPPEATITILDVSGQIIDQIKFSSSDPNNGSVFWDMFSKDGMEVASGVYIYTVESPSGGMKVGHFAILR